jgi:transcriptional regulator with XRE-family HTH domain
MTDAQRREQIDQLVALLQQIGWSERDLADRLELRVGRVVRWLNGYNAAPERLLVWLRHLALAHSTGDADIIAEAHRRHARPDGWDEPRREGSD